MYDGGGLIDLDQSDLAYRRIYLVQGNSRLRNVLDNTKLGDVFVGSNAEDPTADKVGSVDEPFTLYVMAVSKGVTHIDKDNNGKITFLTGQPDAEARLTARERDIWRSYHYVVKVEGIDEPVSWMLTGYSGTKSAQDVNGMIAGRVKSGFGITPILVKVVTKSNGSNTWATFKAFPTTGDNDEIDAAASLVASGIDRMHSRQVETEAPGVVDNSTY